MKLRLILKYYIVSELALGSVFPTKAALVPLPSDLIFDCLLWCHATHLPRQYPCLLHLSLLSHHVLHIGLEVKHLGI